MAFTGIVITRKGQEALAKAQNEGELKIMGIAVGDGRYDGACEDAEALANQLTVLEILKVDTQRNACTLEADLSNAELEDGYYLREIGVMAQAGDDQVLYAYAYAGEDAEYIPAKGSVTVEKRFAITLIVDGVESITFEQKSALYLTQQDFDKHLEAENPHGITTKMIGALPQKGTAEAAKKLSTAYYIDGGAFNGTKNIFHQGGCNEAASVKAKTVSIPDVYLSFGTKITVRFVNGNTASEPTLNLNNSGAYPIIYKGKKISANCISQETILELVFTNNQEWLVVGDVTHAQLGVDKMTWLSDLEWSYVRQDYEATNKDKNCKGEDITLRDSEGTSFVCKKGIGTHANGEVHYALTPGEYNAFESLIGVNTDGTEYCNGIKFRIYCDTPAGEKELYRNDDEVFTQLTPAKNVYIAIPENATKLRLYVIAASDTGAAWANWGNAMLIKCTDTSSLESQVAGLNKSKLDAKRFDREKGKLQEKMDKNSEGIEDIKNRMDLLCSAAPALAAYPRGKAFTIDKYSYWTAGTPISSKPGVLYQDGAIGCCNDITDKVCLDKDSDADYAFALYLEDFAEEITLDIYLANVTGVSAYAEFPNGKFISVINRLRLEEGVHKFSSTIVAMCKIRDQNKGKEIYCLYFFVDNSYASSAGSSMSNVTRYAVPIAISGPGKENIKIKFASLQ